jgi:hypothetical protein
MPEASPTMLSAAFGVHLPATDIDDEIARDLHAAYGPDRYDLVDRAYVMGVHPLELWLVAHLTRHPDAGWSDTVAASADERIEVYRWLYRTGRRKAQDVRIRTILEIEAFLEIHQAWQRHGYPFDRLVPSLATSIGASADRPSALADLMGIILNDGVRQPTHRVSRLHFAADTPYETVIVPAEPALQRVFPAEVARVVRDALADVVENGTARRAHKAFAAKDRTAKRSDAATRSDDAPAVRVGGKTGTGDHREKIYARGNRQIGERVKRRAATFVFFVGDRFYGVVTAHVSGPEAAEYRFTSGLPVQIFAHLAPVLRDLLDRTEPSRNELVAQKPTIETQPAVKKVPIETVPLPAVAQPIAVGSPGLVR